MASPQSLPDSSDRAESDRAALFIDEQNIIIHRFWQAFGCAAPIILFWIGVLIVGSLTGW